MGVVVGLGIAQAELQVLAYAIRAQENIHEVEEQLFFTDQAKVIYRALAKLVEHGVTVTSQTLAAEINLATNQRLTDVALSGLWLRKATDADYAYFRKKLIEARDKEDLHQTVVKDLIATSTTKSELNMEEIAALHGRLSAFLQRSNQQPSVVLGGRELADGLEQTLLRRQQGETAYSTGCSFLDQRLNDRFAPGTQTILFGATGSGKTNFALALTMRQMHRGIPTVYFSLEMGREQLSDRLFCMKTGIPMSKLQPHLNDGLIPEEVFHRMQLFKKQLYAKETFRLVDEPSMSLADLEYHIQTIKRQMGVEYMCVTIDLASMIREFYAASRSGSKADQIEACMNELNYMAKRYNIHILSVVQSNREQDNVKILKLEDIEKCRPTLGSIKSSHSYAERARVVLGIHRPRYYVEKYLPERISEVPSTIEIDILKQSQGASSRLNYFFAGDTAQIFMQAPTGQKGIANDVHRQDAGVAGQVFRELPEPRPSEAE